MKGRQDEDVVGGDALQRQFRSAGQKAGQGPGSWTGADQRDAVLLGGLVPLAGVFTQPLLGSASLGAQPPGHRTASGRDDDRRPDRTA